MTELKMDGKQNVSLRMLTLRYFEFSYLGLLLETLLLFVAMMKCSDLKSFTFAAA